MVMTYYYRRLKNRKSGWLTRTHLNHLSASCRRRFANWHSNPPLGVHRDPLNLYEAKPKTGNDILGTPSISLDLTIGACAPFEPERNHIRSHINVTKLKLGFIWNAVSKCSWAQLLHNQNTVHIPQPTHMNTFSPIKQQREHYQMCLWVCL